MFVSVSFIWSAGRNVDVKPEKYNKVLTLPLPAGERASEAARQQLH
jgi:hypothetical protein